MVEWPSFTGRLVQLSQNGISPHFPPNIFLCDWQWIKLHQTEYAHRVYSFFISGFLYSVLVSVLEAKAMGHSVPSLITWDSTVLMFTEDASQASLSGSLGSWCDRTCSEVIYLSLCGMLPGTVLSISTNNSSPKAGSGTG